MGSRPGIVKNALNTPNLRDVRTSPEARLAQGAVLRGARPPGRSVPKAGSGAPACERCEFQAQRLLPSQRSRAADPGPQAGRVLGVLHLGSTLVVTGLPALDERTGVSCPQTCKEDRYPPSRLQIHSI